MSKSIFLFRLLPCSLLIVLMCSLVACAQNVVPMDPPKAASKPDSPNSNDKGRFLFGSLDDEMKAKRRIKLEEKLHQENLERAREADRLSTELETSYEQKKLFTPEDTKKLERLEKLTKKIRGEAGGSDEGASLENPPNELQIALSRLAQVTAALHKVVEKTPR